MSEAPANLPDPRSRIFARVRAALEGRETTPHPGRFGSWKPLSGGATGDPPTGASSSSSTEPIRDGSGAPRDASRASRAPTEASRPTEAARSRETLLQELEHMFSSAGGRVVRVPDLAGTAEWLVRSAARYRTMVVGRGVPEGILPDLERAPAEVADLGVSLARAAVAETGTFILDARDGRRAQLLAPTHVILVRAADVHATLDEALRALRHDLPSALGLHSGPSKSADIGQVMVRGVHGPGEAVALVVGPTP